MLYRLVRPVKRTGSSKQQFVQRIPADLRDRMVGMKLAVPIGGETAFVTITPKTESIRFSLKTGDPSAVKNRQADAAAYLEQIFRSLREDKPVALTHRQAVALSGELYRAWASDYDHRSTISFVQNADGTVERDDSLDLDLLEAGYASIVKKLGRLKEDGDAPAVENALGPLVDRLLLAHSIPAIDPASRPMVLREFLKALREGMEVRQRKAGGDYSPDPRSERFPEWKAPGRPQTAPSVSLTGLVESWWQEAKASGLTASTHESYRKAAATLAAFLKHDDASRVTADDLVRFKDHLLVTVNPKTDRTLSAKTVKDSYLSGLRSVFSWAVNNRKMGANPATGITIKVGKQRRLRESWFTPREVTAILTASANAKKGPKEKPQRHGLMRWVPWLCAYTGARVGEIVQLRKEDVRQEGKHWIITITPEAGTVKDKERREVPLHPHLVETGFPAFVKAAADGHLFMWSGTDRSAWRTAKNRLTEFVRTVVKDPNIQPNHAWRHTFKTMGSEAGIQDKVLDAICGHDPRTVGEGYGGVTLVTKVKAMDAFPRFKIDRN
ncbi:site-specific integrase [Mesorhizobium sp. ESP7-2]|uniref:tyrosine-type recombinase/integrase n=1 Tax=Mesorhizobium sp. ESP7-2 TaxID=2876622 RepID=UPI001CD025D5|nr:tyrosine-type recombinase/integrase [Mesorhizobium sp. ESP7-2]MBZ9705695.1 site-specific integrase [Mesorhizobium sp. ESP7-2]